MKVSGYNLQALRLSGVQGAGEARSEPYMKYGEGALEPTTQQSAKSAGGAASFARRQASAAKRSQRPFAVFDIDGTLLRWQLYHATVDALAKAGKIDADKFASARAARMVWKNRASDSSFKDYEKALVEMYDQAVQNISYDDYLAAVKKVFAEYKGQTYTYTRDLIRELKARNYILFAISASQIEAVELLAKHYGFDDFAGSKYELAGGKFTGEKDVLFGSKKPLALAAGQS